MLSPIADVRPGETTSVLLLTLTMFLMLSGYYMLKTAREVFILTQGGAEVKSYASAGQAILLLMIVPAYGALASRVNRRQLITWVTLFFASNIIFFALAVRAGLHVGIPYFLWIGIFNVMVIAQYWAFANDLYSSEQGKRLFPLIGVGSSLGAWVGSVRAGALMRSVGPVRLLTAGLIILIICVVLVRLADRVACRHPTTKAPPPDEPVGEGPNGFKLIFSDRYLTLIALLTLLLNVVNTSGEYLFGRYVVQSATALYGTGAASEAARGQFIGDAYSRLFGAVNLLGLLLQMFVVSRLFRFLGVGKSLYIHPTVAGIGYLLMLRSPSFETIRVLKVADNALDYSLGNTTKQALWLPTSRQAKYKAKQAVDSFFMRAGDVIQAGLVYMGELAGFAVPAFAAINLVLTAAWLAVVTGIRRQRAETPAEAVRQI
jgi:AAA family ATP:ADP antiporter